MLAARDQENLVHAHQTAAAGKPLNQTVRGLQPKTPGNRAPKTPFREALNDENKPLVFNGRKTALKGLGNINENLLQPGKKDGKLDKNTFVTPLGECSRQTSSPFADDVLQVLGHEPHWEPRLPMPKVKHFKLLVDRNRQ